MVAAVGVKVVAAVSLSGTSYLLGALPSCLGLGKVCGHSLVLSVVLCFGGGVLLATSLVHVQAEARAGLSATADIVFCVGFMLLYMIDEFIKLYENKNMAHCQLEVEGLLDRTVHHRYGSVCQEEHQGQDQGEEQCEQEEHQGVSVKIKDTQKRIGLILAFSVHSIIEGLVIGVQPVPAKILLLLGAISSHKLVVSFCLGAELMSDGRSFMSLSHSLLVYSLGSSVGIILGMLIDRWKTTSTIISIPVLQALAAGSLLYVTVSEVLPRERSRWEHQAQHRYAGLLQFLSFLLGFSVITSLVMFT